MDPKGRLMAAVATVVRSPFGSIVAATTLGVSASIASSHTPEAARRLVWSSPGTLAQDLLY